MALGCVAEERTVWFDGRQAARNDIFKALEAVYSSEDLVKLGINVRRDGTKQSLFQWLRFPNITISSLEDLEACLKLGDFDLLAEIEEDARYAPYLERQESELRDLRANEQIRLGDDMDYAVIAGLSNEMVERLATARPETLAAASRIRGITPAALAAILVHARRRDNRNIAA
jgi:tRNA uridine 5-carboxymethylaminomethyl modification enzyme